MRRFLAIAVTLALAGCRGCGAGSEPAPPASASAAASAEPPSGRPLPSGGIAPGSWKKGYVPNVAPPVTSSSPK